MKNYDDERSEKLSNHSFRQLAGPLLMIYFPSRPPLLCNHSFTSLKLKRGSRPEAIKGLGKSLLSIQLRIVSLLIPICLHICFLK